MKREFKPEQITWSDEIEQKISARQLKIINGDEINKRWTANKTTIEHAIEHVCERNLDAKIIAPLNHVRIFKKLKSPCELFGICRIKQTEAAREPIAKSCITQNDKIEEVPRPSNKTIALWNEFLEWMKVKRIETIIDFSQKMNARIEVCDDGHMRVRKDNKWKYYKKGNEQRGQRIVEHGRKPLENSNQVGF